MNIDRRLRSLVARVGAEKVVIAVTYNKHSRTVRYGQDRHPFEIEVEWEDHGEKFHAGGDVEGASLKAVLGACEAEINGILLRTRAGEGGS